MVSSRSTSVVSRPASDRLQPAVRAAGRALAVVLAVGSLAATVVSCRDVTAPMQDPKTIAYAASLGINLASYTLDTSGVYYRDLAVGSGTKAVLKSTVSYLYKGQLADGRYFDSSATNSTPLTFVIGAGGVIRGFDRGLVGVNAGGRRSIIIPPALGYGDRSQGTRIPAGSVLVFTVDVPAVAAPAS